VDSGEHPLLGAVSGMDEATALSSGSSWMGVNRTGAWPVAQSQCKDLRW